MKLPSGAVLLLAMGAGVVLTVLLLWGLAGYSGMGAGTAAQTPVPPESGKVFVPAAQPDQPVPEPIPAKPVAANLPPADPAAVASQPQTPPRVSAKPVVLPPVVPLPAPVVLSPQEVGHLSDKERRAYQKMLESYRQIQEQAQNLEQERERLGQRLEDMSGRNRVLEAELEAVREALGKDGVSTPPPTGDGGKP